MQALVDKGEMDESKMKLILERGDRLLKLAKLKKPRDPSDCAPWEKWRMVIFGVEYGRKFDTFKDWAKHFGYPIRQMDEYDYLDDDDDPFGSDTIEWGGWDYETNTTEAQNTAEARPQSTEKPEAHEASLQAETERGIGILTTSQGVLA